jgi:hypothetical protein
VKFDRQFLPAACLHLVVTVRYYHHLEKGVFTSAAGHSPAQESIDLLGGRMRSFLARAAFEVLESRRLLANITGSVYQDINGDGP